jgi:hypothetical protein
VLGWIAWVTKNGLNMYGWYGSPASRSQVRPRQACRLRLDGFMPGSAD